MIPNLIDAYVFSFKIRLLNFKKYLSIYDNSNIDKDCTRFYVPEGNCFNRNPVDGEEVSVYYVKLSMMLRLCFLLLLFVFFLEENNENEVCIVSWLVFTRTAVDLNAKKEQGQKRIKARGFKWKQRIRSLLFWFLLFFIYFCSGYVFNISLKWHYWKDGMEKKEI